MKRNIVISLLICFFLNVYADETEHKMLVSGRTWNYIKLYLTPTVPDTVYQSITIDGPVEFDGKQCYKFANVALEDAKTFFYEEGGKVYSYSVNNSGNHVWREEFDFNLEVGEKDLIAVDKMMINGEYHRRLIFFNDIWIEGIGSILDGIVSSWGFVPMTFLGSRLLTVYDGDLCIFNSDDYRWPAVAAVVTGVDVVEARKKDNTSIFDLYGRRLTSNPQKGLYIRDGKKYVIK